MAFWGGSVMPHRLVAVAVLVAWLVVAAGAPVSAATVIADPAVFVRQVYDRLARGVSEAPPDDIYSPRLQALWADEARDAAGEVGRIDFLFWINGQDGTVSHVRIRTAPVEGRADRQIVSVRFRNGARPEALDFYFERLDGAWRLDDVVSLARSDPWTLSVILKYGWPR
jgi:hypothetical protein